MTKGLVLVLAFVLFSVPVALWSQNVEPPEESAPVPSGPIIPQQVSENYIIGQGDQLEVTVWRNEQLSRQVVVMPDGKISLPLIQQVQAAGLSLANLRDQITQKLSPYVESPRVTVIVTQLNSYRVSVLGNVAKPGVYPITGKTTVIEAISMAGGLTDWARKRKITVIRNPGGKNEEQIRVNYNKIASGKDPSENIVLKRGDTIIVP
jgi:polysaccharide export outer membrane protein